VLSEHHSTLAKSIGGSEINNAVGGTSIPPCTATFLVVVLHGLADRVVDDEADIRFVYSHAEGHSSNYHLVMEEVERN
jgi:hypothetical protein